MNRREREAREQFADLLAEAGLGGHMIDFIELGLEDLELVIVPRRMVYASIRYPRRRFLRRKRRA